MPKRVACSQLVGGDAPAEFLLLRFGPIDVERPLSGRGFNFTRQHAEQAVSWFAQLGRELAIDYEHQSLTGGGPAARRA